MSKPTVALVCPANAYSGPSERIVEFSYRHAGQLYGGLIAFHGTEHGLIVDVYRCDPGVQVRCAPALLASQGGAPT